MPKASYSIVTGKNVSRRLVLPLEGDSYSDAIASRCSGRYPCIGQPFPVQVLQDDEHGAEAIYHPSVGGTVLLLVARQRAATRKRNQTPARFCSRKIDKRRSFGRFRPKSERFHSKLPAQGRTDAEVAGVSILTGRRQAVRTPANRRSNAKLWWKQTKGGSGAGPKPPRVNQELEEVRSFSLRQTVQVIVLPVGMFEGLFLALARRSSWKTMSRAGPPLSDSIIAKKCRQHRRRDRRFPASGRQTAGTPNDRRRHLRMQWQ